MEKAESKSTESKSTENKSTENKSSDAARQLYLQQSYGVLSTHSVEVAGYPFGSVVPYCQDLQGQPLILISRLAQHTKNIAENPRVSLLVLDDAEENKQNAGRLTLLAEAQRCVESEDNIDELATLYYQHFPSAAGYHSELDFDFYRLKIHKIRYIGGLGKIHWLSPENFLKSNPFSFAELQGMVTHMNVDHQEAMAHYCQVAGYELGDSDGDVQMCGIDSEGFKLKLAEKLIRFWFPRVVNTTKEAREALVLMAKR